MPSTPADRATIRRMLTHSGCEADTAAREMHRRFGRDLAEMQALAAEVWAEAVGTPRYAAELPGLVGALAHRAAVFGPHSAQVAA